jgi:O-antigen/teichoic acid export membrane protein
VEGERYASEITGASPAVHGVVLLSITTLAAVLGGYAFHVVAARWLIISDYGLLVLVLSIITWAENIQGAVLSGAVKAVSEDHRRLSAALKMSVRWFLPSGLIAWLILLAISPLIASGLQEYALLGLLVLAAIEIPLTALMRMTARFTNAMRLYALNSAINLVYIIGRTAFGCSLIMLGFGAFGAVAGQVAATALAASIGLFLILRASWELPEVLYPQMLSRSISWAGYGLGYSFAISTLLAIDLWCVNGMLSDPDLAGIYGAAFAIARTPKFLVQAVAGAVFPRVSQAHSQGNTFLASKVTEESFRLLFIIFIPICILVGESSTEIITLLFTERYSEADVALTILMTALCVFAFYQLLLSLIEATNRPGVRTFFAISLVPVGLVLNFLLIPHHGINGAAAATLATMVIGVLVVTPLVLKYTKSSIPAWTIFRCAIAGMIVYISAYAWGAEGWMLIPKLGLLGLGYVVILFLIGELGSKEIRSVASVFPGRLGTELKRFSDTLSR